MSAARLPPPLAGRPPYATDEDDSVYEPQHPRPVHQPPRPNPRHSNASQYNVYDEYLSGSHDDSHSHSPPPTGPPSYPQPSAPVSPYTASPPQYSPVQRDGTQMQPQISPQARPQNLAIHIPSAPDATSPQSRRPNPGPSLIPAYMPSPFSPAPGYPANGVPPGFGGPGYYPAPPLPPPVASFTPHPLPPSTPITPYFAAPPREPFNVKFSSESQIPIMRAYNEETLLTKSQPGANGGIRERRAEGDEFWRRFSMVAHKEGSKGNGQSQWLRETQSGAGRMSRWVWIISIILLLGIGAGIALGLIFTHGKPSHNPKALGGAGCEGTNGRTCSSSIEHPGAYGPGHSATPTASHTATTSSTAAVHARSTPAPVSPYIGAVNLNHDLVPRSERSTLLERFVILPASESSPPLPQGREEERRMALKDDFLMGRHKALGRRRRIPV